MLHISSFSKTVSPNLRVGFLVASGDLVNELARLKMIAGLTSSEFGERIAHEAVTDVQWRRHLKRLRERLATAHERIAGRLLALGLELFSEPKQGLFLWARHPAWADTRELSERAAQQGILLGPGHLFGTEAQPSAWLRFNVAFCDDERIFDFLQSQLPATSGCPPGTGT